MQINHIVSNSLSKHTNNSTKTTYTPDIIESKSIMRSSPKNYSKKQIRDLLLPRTHQKINSSIHHEDYYTNFLNELNKEKRNSIHLSIIQLNKKNSHSKKIKNVYTPTNLSSEKKRKSYNQNYTNYPKSILRFSRPSKPLHPTQKPVELLEYLIKTYTKEGEVVLDNCMGSGSTGVACLNINRKFIGIEKDEEYFEIACNRIKEVKK